MSNKSSKFLKQLHANRKLRYFLSLHGINANGKKKGFLISEFCRITKTTVPTGTSFSDFIIHYFDTTGKDFKYKKRVTRKKQIEFYESKKWLSLRKIVLKIYGRQCMKCFTASAIIQVDHIKPRSKFPLLELELTNMQVLCKRCNKEKSNLHETDYRTAEHKYKLAKHIESANIEKKKNPRISTRAIPQMKNRIT